MTKTISEIKECFLSVLHGAGFSQFDELINTATTILQIEDIISKVAESLPKNLRNEIIRKLLLCLNKNVPDNIG